MTPAHTLAAALFHSLWLDGLVALAAAQCLALMARRSAAARHAVGLGFLGLMALLPLLVVVLDWPAPGEISSAAILVAKAGAPPLVRGETGPFQLPAWITWAWALGVTGMLARMAGGWWMVRSLLDRPFEPLPAPWQARAERMMARLSLNRAVDLRLCASIAQPCSALAWKPVVWLPLSVLTQLSPEHLEALLAHELAHVARLDWIWNSLQRLVEALYFYHPGVWWLSRRIRREREHACDDVAVALCGDAIALAEALATLEGLQPPTRVLALAATGGSLMERIQRLLLPTSTPPVRWGLPAAILALLGAGSLLAAMAVPAEPGAVTRLDQAGQRFRITDTSTGVLRVYERTMDLLDHPKERYTENGQEKPIDPAVRAWITHQEHQAQAALAQSKAEQKAARAARKQAQAEAARAADEAQQAQAEAAKAESASRQAGSEAAKAKAEAIKADAEAAKAQEAQAKAAQRATWRLQIPSTTRVTDDQDGVTRSYERHTSFLGRVTETYTENGHRKPVTAEVRQWASLAVPPPPPPPVLPIPPVPPPPPLP